MIARDLFEERQRFDFVLTDCEMPAMDGYSATESIRSIEERHGLEATPIIALTAHLPPKFRDKARRPVCPYITKPINRGELLRTILHPTAPRRSAHPD